MIKIENAKYKKIEGTDFNGSITATIDGVLTHVPIVSDNTSYAEIMRQVEAGELTIEPADTEGE